MKITVRRAIKVLSTPDDHRTGMLSSEFYAALTLGVSALKECLRSRETCAHCALFPMHGEAKEKDGSK